MRRSTTLSEALRETAARLRKAGIEQPWLEARLLLERVTGLSHAEQIGRSAEPLAAPALQALDALAARRMAHEPMAYILGRKEFFGLDFEVDSAVLIPRPESELLIEMVEERVPHPGSTMRFLDIGTGSGCLLVTLLTLFPKACGVGTDLSPAALRMARRNADRHGVQERAGWVCCWWAEALRGPFDLVISNPPYVASHEFANLMPEVARFEPRLALDGGREGLDAYRALASELPRLLAPGGLAVVELGRGQGSAVAGLFREQGLEILEVRPDLAGIARAVMARAPQPAATSS